MPGSSSSTEKRIEIQKEREKAKERDKDYDRPRSKLYKDDTKDPPPHEVTGWTAMIEDWLCHGARQASPSPSEISVPTRLSTGCRPRERNGPYQLLIKGSFHATRLSIAILILFFRANDGSVPRNLHPS